MQNCPWMVAILLSVSVQRKLVVAGAGSQQPFSGLLCCPGSLSVRLSVKLRRPAAESSWPWTSQTGCTGLMFLVHAMWWWSVASLACQRTQQIPFNIKQDSRVQVYLRYGSLTTLKWQMCIVQCRAVYCKTVAGTDIQTADVQID